MSTQLYENSYYSLLCLVDSASAPINRTVLQQRQKWGESSRQDGLGRSKKRVGFAELKEARETISLNDMTPAEVQNYYYSDDDYSFFRRSTRNLTEQIVAKEIEREARTKCVGNNGTGEGKTICRRGLETYIQRCRAKLEGQHYENQVVTRSIDAVLIVQQRERERDNHLRMARACAASVRVAVAEAHKLGRNDEKVARTMYRKRKEGSVCVSIVSESD